MYSSFIVPPLCVTQSITRYIPTPSMRHVCLLVGEITDCFLKVLSFYERTKILESLANWQLCRTVRNLASHEYAIDYSSAVEHFNTLQTLIPMLCVTAVRFLNYCLQSLDIVPKQAVFSEEFMAITPQANVLGVNQ
jgi:hypothetical protein